MRAGLYGTGAFGRFLLESLSDSASMRVEALANRTAARGAVVAREYGIERRYDTYEELLADPALEAIIIATPPADHGAAALAALSAGKHIFIEKPLATTLEAADRILAGAAAAHRRVAVDYPLMYTPLVEGLRQFRTSQLCGKLLRISVENIASCDGLDDDHWFWNKELSGGIFVEHGVHFFDWCGALAGAARQVSALTFLNGKREDRVFAAVDHAGGALATYFHAFVTSPENERTRAVISFESVDAVVDGWVPLVLRMYGPSAAVATTTIRRMLDRSVESIPDASAGFAFSSGDKQQAYGRAVRAAVEDFARAVHDPSYVPRNDATRAYASLQVAVAAREAAATGVTQLIAKRAARESIADTARA